MKAVCLLFALLVIPATLCAADCTTSLSGGAASITCVGNVPREVNGNQTWAAALAGLANATSAAMELRDVRFSAVTFSRFLDIALGVGAGPATTSVDVLLTNCSMKNIQGDSALLASLAGTKSYSVRAEGCQFVGNSLNATATLATQADFALSVQLDDSVVSANKLVALGLVGVGAAGQASLSLSGTQLLDNQAALLGALAVGGSAKLSVQLASSNLTGNSLLQIGLVAAGGEASAQVTGLNDSSVAVQRNTLDSRVEVAGEQKLVASVLDVVTGLAFNKTGFSLPTALDEVQRQLCATLAAADWAAVGAELRGTLRPLADQLGGLLCSGGGVSPDVKLSSLAGKVEELAGEGLGALASLLEGVLGDPALGQGLVSALQGDAPLGPVLDSLLTALLANTDVQNGLGFLGGLVSQLGEWLGQPIGGGGDGTARPSGLDLGGAISDIISQIGGGGEGGLVGTLQGIIDGVVAAIGGGGNGTALGATPADAINSIVGAIAGADSPLAGQDVTSLVPVLGAVLQDPQALASLPGLLGGLLGGGQSGGGGGGLDLAALGPILGAINSDPQAAAALPAALGLLGQLMGGDGGSLLGR